MSMTDEELAAIEQRASMATPGPWSIVGPEWRGVVGSTPGCDDIVSRCGGDTYTEQILNADFIAAARTDVPTLVAEVRRLWGRLDEARAVIVKLQDELRGRVPKSSDHVHAELVTVREVLTRTPVDRRVRVLERAVSEQMFPLPQLARVLEKAKAGQDAVKAVDEELGA